MIIAIWGRSGTGKSTIANELGRMYAADGNITVVVDTDMTHPTLPMRLPGVVYNNKASLGEIFASTHVRDARRYLHQHPKNEKLFYAGLTMDDNFLSYEIGMRQYSQSEQFIKACQDVADVIVLDLSGQRGDPFLAVATAIPTKAAEAFILTLTPDIRNVCWYTAVKPLLTKTRAENNKEIFYLANMVQKHHVLPEFVKLTGIEFDAMLPFSRSVNEADGQGNFASHATDHPAVKWQKEISRVIKTVNERCKT